VYVRVCACMYVRIDSYGVQKECNLMAMCVKMKAQNVVEAKKYVSSSYSSISHSHLSLSLALCLSVNESDRAITIVY